MYAKSNSLQLNYHLIIIDSDVKTVSCFSVDWSISKEVPYTVNGQIVQWSKVKGRK